MRDYTPDKLMEFFDDENEGIHIINEEDLTDGRADNAYGEDNAYGRDRAYGEDNANGKNNDYVEDINYAGNNNYAKNKTYIRNNNRVKGKAYTKDNDSIIDKIYDRNDNYNNNNNFEGTVIKDVMPEIINTDKPDKRSKNNIYNKGGCDGARA